MPNPNQIILCNLTLKTIKRKGEQVKTVILKDTIFSYPESGERNKLDYNKMEDRKLIHRAGLKESVLIEKVEVISYHGFKNQVK